MTSQEAMFIILLILYCISLMPICDQFQYNLTILCTYPPISSYTSCTLQYSSIFINRKVLTAVLGAMSIIVAVGHLYFLLPLSEKKEVPFSMAIGNEELGTRVLSQKLTRKNGKNLKRQRNRGSR